MNVAELERLLEQGQDWDNVEGEIARLELAAKWEYLTRRVIAAERLVEALHTARDYVSDAHIGCLVYDDGKRVSEAMTTEDLAMIDAYITAYEAQQ